jgi:hypothetical protein
MKHRLLPPIADDALDDLHFIEKEKRSKKLADKKRDKERREREDD